MIESAAQLSLNMGDQKAVVVGLSGCSSSGKTTLARLLRDIFPNTFILHEDDFYRPEEESVLPRQDESMVCSPLADTSQTASQR